MKALETQGTDLDFSRYGDTLFELLFTGGRSSGGGTEVEYGETGKLETNVRAPARRAAGRKTRGVRRPRRVRAQTASCGAESRLPARALYHTAAAHSPPAFQVFASEPEVLAVKPYVVAFQHILRCAPRAAPPPPPAALTPRL